MDTSNWRPTQGGTGAVGDNSMESGDWRAQLQADSRQRIVNKIMDTLKRHLPFSGHEGLQELKKIAERFEEKIYTAATSQSDYLRKISLKMLTMETRSQNPMGDAMQSNSATTSVNPSDPVPGFASLFTGDERAVERIARLLGLPEIDRTFGIPGGESVETMSGTGKATPRFGLEDIDNLAESRVKKEAEKTEKVPAEDKPTSRVKMIKRKKGSENQFSSFFADKDLLGIEDMVFDAGDSMFKKLRADQQKMEEALQRSEMEMAKMKAEMGVIREEKEKEVVAAVDEARDAASLAVFQSRIKMAKEATDPSFDRATWDVEQWEHLVQELTGELGKKVVSVPRI